MAGATPLTAYTGRATGKPAGVQCLPAVASRLGAGYAAEEMGR